MCVCVSSSVLRSIRVDSPLTAVDFTPDGTGLVVGSTQGKIYQYDLRNSGAPTRVTVAHKTSVTCLRFHNNASRQKVGRAEGAAGCDACHGDLIPLSPSVSPVNSARPKSPAPNVLRPKCPSVIRPQAPPPTDMWPVQVGSSDRWR